jgi:diguanylate cyclase (GGDEF)-like protein
MGTIEANLMTLTDAECQIDKIEAFAGVGRWQWDFAGNASTTSTTSAEFCRICGHAPGWQPGLDDLLALVDAEERERIQHAWRDAFAARANEISYTCRTDGLKGPIHLHVHACVEYGADGSALRVRGLAKDVSGLKEVETRLYELAFLDTLTGLPNRALFNDRLSQSLIEAARHGHVLGLLLLDLDRFKEINDAHSHAIGDRVLLETADRLRHLLRDYDTVSRLGGDEFSLVLPEVRTAEDLGRIAGKILDVMAAPFHIDDQDLFLSVSIGISVFPGDGASESDLLRCAELALYDAKNRGRAGFRFYAADLTAKSHERAELEAALRRAEPMGELDLYFQPKIALADGALLGAEALLRWRHPTRGLLSPDCFIGIAEDTGLIVGMGVWVLTKACLAAQHLNLRNQRNQRHQRHQQELKIAVNLSARQFAGGDLVETVSSVLSLTGCEPRWLEFEITESLLLGDDECVRATLNTFRDMGISIAIDDFGTGYSSLGYLKRFPIDVLKIDRSFTRDLMVDADSTELVKAIVYMARCLKLELVAEGVETEDQEKFLRQHGCHIGQGYLFGKPMPFAAFEGQTDRQQPLLALA